ncbi:MAG TPA: shikimate dehydrogenase [Alphaproteobacteria bacterium]|nr:shikimate dehydrogenase [Alphaproteobacteria bacterium]
MILRAGVIGWPVGHSLSPRIHRFWLAELGIAGRYEAVVVSPDWLEDIVDSFRKAGWCGFNVTVPHKETIIPLLDSIEPAARDIGAVNTVVAVGEGKFEGRNTDAPGFLASIRAARAIRTDRPAVVLGAGGAARAILAALSSAGVREIRIANRNRERAEALAAAFPAIVCDWDDRARMLEGCGLLINSTSLGMTGQPPLEIDLARLPATALVTDIVYRPLETDLLAKARARGNPAVDGLGMLLHQAVEGFAAWFGVTPDVTPALRDHVLAAIQHGA